MNYLASQKVMFWEKVSDIIISLLVNVIYLLKLIPASQKADEWYCDPCIAVYAWEI